MKIFTEFHNQDLYYSLQLLFEKRLRHELYRPIGVEWFDQGFWKIAEPYQNNSGTIQQFLGVNSQPEDKTHPLNDVESLQNGIYRFKDEVHNDSNKGITFDAFTKNKFDIIIASIPQHIEPYKRLIKQYQPEAKLIFQIGNIWWHKTTDFSQVPNVMASVARFDCPSNTIFYHQEFSLDVFKPQNKQFPKKEIVSFVNNLPNGKYISKYKELEMLLPGYTFKMYGGGCENGTINGVQAIANVMNASKFGLHLKPDGDGFGHILYNWFACGKPVIICGKDYYDKLGNELLIDGETCIDLDKHLYGEVVDKIQKMTDWEYDYMCSRVKEIFKEKVNFDKEAEEIKIWLDNLK